MLYSRSEKHLGTTFEIQIVSEKAYTEEVLTELFLFCEDFEAEFSRFREDSSLSILNKEKQLSVSLRFIDLLTLPCIITIENTLVTLSESTSLDF